MASARTTAQKARADSHAQARAQAQSRAQLQAKADAQAPDDIRTQNEAIRNYLDEYMYKLTSNLIVSMSFLNFFNTICMR